MWSKQKFCCHHRPLCVCLQALADCDVVFVCLKCNDIASCGPLTRLRPGAVVVSLQNGVDNAARLRGLLPGITVVAGMVPYGVNEVSPGHFHRGTYGPLAFDDSLPMALQDVLRRSGLQVEIHPPKAMEAVMWGKLLINLQNAPNALVGRPLVECLADGRYRQVMTAAWLEGLETCRDAGIPVKATLNHKPLGTVIKLMRQPELIYRIVRRFAAVKKPDPAYRSSMWTDLDQKRRPEVDDLNLKIVQLAEQNGKQAPVNKLLAELVEEAHAQQEGSPNLSIGQLFALVEARCPGAVVGTTPSWVWWAAAATVAAAVVAAVAARQRRPRM